jgi:hypothetical protein
MTPETAIVERCARAAQHEFHKTRRTQPIPWERIVLAVLRELAECEPTPAMVDACGYEHLGLKAKAEEAAEDWRAMLRALAEAAGRG